MTCCQICESPDVTHCCSGLDVPMLHFCVGCAGYHAATCPDIKRGAAKMVECDKAHDGDES